MGLCFPLYKNFARARKKRCTHANKQARSTREERKTGHKGRQAPEKTKKVKNQSRKSSCKSRKKAEKGKKIGGRNRARLCTGKPLYSSFFFLKYHTHASTTATLSTMTPR